MDSQFTDDRLLAEMRHLTWQSKLTVHFDQVRYRQSAYDLSLGRPSIHAGWALVIIVNLYVLLFILAMVGSKVALLAPATRFADILFFKPLNLISRGPIKVLLPLVVGTAITMARRYRYLHKPAMWNALWTHGCLSLALSDRPSITCSSPDGDWRKFILDYGTLKLS